MRHEPDVAVIGAGIAGLTTALALAERGFRVTVLDDARPGSASRASAGMLAAGFGFGGTIGPLAIAAREAYPAFVERLHDLSGILVPLDRRGIVQLPDGEADLARLHDAASAGAERLEAVDLAALDPVLSLHAGGVFHPCDGAVDTRILMDALSLAVQRDARIAIVERAVDSVDLSSSAPRVGLADGSALTVHRIVVAAGAWAGQIGGLPRPLPLRPVRGELLVLDAERPRHVVYGAGGYLIPRPDGVLVGATNAEDGYRVRTTAEGRTELLAIADRMAQLGGGIILRHWAGLRPMSPDGLPILGPDPDDPRVVHAAGLSRNGILFAPWAAAQLARSLDDGITESLAPFSVARFR